MTVTATSYIDPLVSVLRGAPDRTVLRSAGTGTTGAEVLAGIYRYARVLDAQGVGPGDLVALLAPNRPEAAVDIGESGVSPVALQDTLCRQPSVRYAVLVADPGRGWIAAADIWPGGAVDAEQCHATVAEGHGREVRRCAAPDAGRPDPADRAGQAQPSRHPRLVRRRCLPARATAGSGPA